MAAAKGKTRGAGKEGARNASARVVRTDSTRAGVSFAIVRARLDNAADTQRNSRHWANSDGFSPDRLMNATTRKKLRDRARYEYHNNSYAHGIVRTIANDVVGTGPRLQIVPEGRISIEDAQATEALWAEWVFASGLPETLRDARAARAHTGESFILLTSNEAIDGKVKLAPVLIEADRVTSGLGNELPVDGIAFDTKGNPSVYYVLPEHPGSGGMRPANPIPAVQVIHYFMPVRPEQRRGIPDLTPVLGLFAQLRRFTEATLDAAELAARFAGVLKTDAPPDGEGNQPEPMDVIDLEPNALLTLPAGWSMEQVKAEHPASSYPEFKREILSEIGRCLNVPYNVASGNSSDYNYASGRLDFQVYFRAIRVDQTHIGRIILDRLFAEWLAEASRIEGYLPQSLRKNLIPKHTWYWDGAEHVDPLKEANAQAVRLASHTTTLASEYAKKGEDWRVQLKQRAEELRVMGELGLPFGGMLVEADPNGVDESEEGIGDA